jgi:hypothetical protein
VAYIDIEMAGDNGNGENAKREWVVLGGGQRQWGICGNEGVFMQQRRVAIKQSFLYAQRL